MTLLELDAVEAAYGVVPALFGVDLRIEQGEVVALLGRNGMGKSTTVKVICRLMRHSSGNVVFAGQDLSSLPSYRAARLGLGLVPEGRRCFADLSVRENLMAAARAGRWNLDRIGALFPRLLERLEQPAVSLSGGEQQMLSIARALMTDPRLLILDEATEGLAPVVRQEIWRVIATLKRDEGLSILIIDKSIAELSRIADRAVVLERGRSVWTGAFSALDTGITERYLGIGREGPPNA